MLVGFEVIIEAVLFAVNAIERVSHTLPSSPTILTHRTVHQWAFPYI